MPQLPHTYIVFRDDRQMGAPTVAQNSETGDIDFEGADAAEVIAQTFGANW